MRKQVMVLAISAVTLAVAPACATKGFVRESVGEVNEKVGTLGKSLEETQERVRAERAEDRRGRFEGRRREHRRWDRAEVRRGRRRPGDSGRRSREARGSARRHRRG